MRKRKMRVSELASYLGVSRHTVYKWVQMGWVPVGRAGRALVFDMDTIEAWVNDRGSHGHIENPTNRHKNRLTQAGSRGTCGSTGRST